VGESEKAVRGLFAPSAPVRPSVVFFDEIDGLVTSRGAREDSTRVGDRVLSQLLTELDGSASPSPSLGPPTGRTFETPPS